MAKDNSRTEAEKIVRNWFVSADDEAITRNDILKKVTESTFYNYMTILKKYDLAQAVKDDPADKRKTTKVALTEKGKQVIARKNGASDRTLKPGLVNLVPGDYPRHPRRQKSLDDLFELADVLEEQDPKLNIKIFTTREDRPMSR